MTTKDTPLADALSEFTQWGMARYSQNTVRTYADLIRRFIRFAGDVPIGKIDITDVTRYYAHLKSKGYHESSIAYMMISLRQLMKFLFLRGLVSWDYQLIGVPKYVSKPYAPVEQGEVRSMLDKIDAKSFIGMRDKTLISFLNSSGLRVSEVCGLMVGDLKLEDRHGSIVSKKNRQVRMVFWDEETDGLLRAYMPLRAGMASSEHVFISMDRKNRGGRLSTRSVQRLVASLRTHSNISPHSFRHGLGMRCVKSGIHSRYIQKILGHKNLNSSQIYLDVHDEDVIKAYAKIN